jgi:hypothetical protein
MSEWQREQGDRANGLGPDRLIDGSDWFGGDASALEAFAVSIQPPARPLAILEKLGSSPFERGQFPFIGFLATTYEKVSTFALERSGYPVPDAKPDS